MEIHRRNRDDNIYEKDEDQEAEEKARRKNKQHEQGKADNHDE